MNVGSDQFVSYVMEQLGPLRNITITRFFGGTGIQVGGTQFAMIMRGVLYFVVNDGTRAKYERMGSTCFSYNTTKKRVDVKKYYFVPADLLEDQDQLVALAKEAISVAGSEASAKSKRAPSKRRRTKRSLSS